MTIVGSISICIHRLPVIDGFSSGIQIRVISPTCVPIIVCVIVTQRLTLSCQIINHILVVRRLSDILINRLVQIIAKSTPGKATRKARSKTFQPLHPSRSPRERQSSRRSHYGPYAPCKVSTAADGPSDSAEERPLYNSDQASSLHGGIGSTRYHASQHARDDWSRRTPSESGYESAQERGKEILKKTEESMSTWVHKRQRVVSRICIAVERLRITRRLDNGIRR